MNEPKKTKRSPIFTIIYVVGIALAIGCYVFAEASGYLIPGVSPLALAAVIGTYMYEHYQNHKDNRDGMLIPQLAILGLFAGYNLVIGMIAIVGAILS